MDGAGKIVPEVQQIMDIAKSHDMVLATGHVSRAETLVLVDAARQKGITRIVVTYPLSTRVGANFNVEEQRQMAEKGLLLSIAFSV